MKTGANRDASATAAAVVDALLRCGLGTDEGDAAMLRSAFVAEAEVDFSPCGRKLGLEFDPLRGIASIVGFLAGTSRRQVTSHAVSNARVQVEGQVARLRALVEATHVARDAPAGRFRMMNWYDARLVEADEDWRIARLTIDNIWFEGDPALLLSR